MVDIVKRLRDTIESLRQQLAESQALVDKVIDAANENGFDSIAALIEWLPDLANRPDSTALDSAIRQAKREALLEAADSEECVIRGLTPSELRRMAHEHGEGND